MKYFKCFVVLQIWSTSNSSSYNFFFFFFYKTCKTLSLWTSTATVAWRAHPTGWVTSCSSVAEMASDSPGGGSETEKSRGLPQLKHLVGRGKWKSLSHVQLFATPWTVAHQAPLSMEFSRQEYWSGLPCPSFSKGSSQPRDWSQVSNLLEDSLLSELLRKPPKKREAGAKCSLLTDSSKFHHTSGTLKYLNIVSKTFLLGPWLSFVRPEGKSANGDSHCLCKVTREANKWVTKMWSFLLWQVCQNDKMAKYVKSLGFYMS